MTTRPDGSPHTSVVKAGVLEHPVTRQLVVGFVSRGGVRKLGNLRAHRHITVVFRSGWALAAVEGDAQLAGPDDRLDGLNPTDIPRLLRAVCAAAAGGTEADWAALDGAMATERHTAVLLHPRRVYPTATD